MQNVFQLLKQKRLSYDSVNLAFKHTWYTDSVAGIIDTKTAQVLYLFFGGSGRGSFITKSEDKYNQPNKTAYKERQPYMDHRSILSIT